MNTWTSNGIAPAEIDVYANPEWTFLAKKAEVSRPFSNSARLSLPEYDASSILYCVIFYMLIC